jgi:Zn-dependent alcohol dehydrogenase
MQIKTTEAAILVESRRPLVLDLIELPTKLGENQILVELITSGVCGAQVNEIDAVKGPDKFLPHLLGHEGYGEVVEIGPKVTKVSRGDKVVLHWRPGTGRQSSVPTYKWDQKVLNAGWVTTFNRHSVVSENRVTKVPANHNKFFLPLLGCALTTALGVLKNEAKITPNEHLLIFGLGGLGNAILQFSKVFGVKNITVVDTDIKKENLALNNGANSFFLFQSKSQTIKLLENHFKNTSKPTVAIETSGKVDSIEICYELSDEESKIILLGVPKLGNNISIYTLPLHLGKTLSGSKGGSSKPETDIPEILKLLNSGLITIDKFPTQIYPFSKINQCISDLRVGMPYRPIIEF